MKPCDIGMMNLLKRNWYRHYDDYIVERAMASEDGVHSIPKITREIVSDWVEKAWREVPEETAKKCWRHAGYIS